ncbi:MAG: hypothetical protein ABIJ34_00005, partial [archaeon]
MALADQPGVKPDHSMIETSDKPKKTSFFSRTFPKLSKLFAAAVVGSTLYCGGCDEIDSMMQHVSVAGEYSCTIQDMHSNERLIAERENAIIINSREEQIAEQENITITES